MTTKAPHCDLPPTPAGLNHCEDHSGLLAWMRGIAALLTLSSALLGYSVFWQAPSIREELAHSIAPLSERIAKLEQWKETVQARLK